MNEPDNQEPNNQQSMIENLESLTDLPLTDVQAEAAKAGVGAVATGAALHLKPLTP